MVPIPTNAETAKVDDGRGESLIIGNGMAKVGIRTIRAIGQAYRPDRAMSRLEFRVNNVNGNQQRIGRIGADQNGSSLRGQKQTLVIPTGRVDACHAFGTIRSDPPLSAQSVVDCR
jgi:hypothetical protein